MRRWQERNRERYDAARRAHKFRRYGLSLADFERLCEAQGDRCAICRSPETDGWDLAVDHDHMTGKVRGLLCRRCNAGLGLLRDDEQLLRRAADYLASAMSTGPLVDSAAASSTDAAPSTANAAP